MRNISLFNIAIWSLVILGFASACQQDKNAFSEFATLDETVMSKMQTWQDTLDWIKKNSDGRTVQTEYLSELPPSGAIVTHTDHIHVTNPLTGKSLEVEAQTINGKVFVEGDIYIGEKAELKNTLESRASAHSNTNLWWDYATIPYVLPSNHPKHNEIIEAINELNRSTNLIIKARTSEPNYVHFINDNNSSSYSSVGNQRRGRQNININNHAGKGTVMHELLHAAGMWHEQSRCDRDNHVSVKWGNISSGNSHNFNKKCSDGKDLSGYNFSSIMHYGPYAFSRNGEATLLPATSNPFLWLDQYFAMGQRSRLGDTDGWSTYYMYPVTPKKPSTIIPNHTRRPIYANGHKGEKLIQGLPEQQYSGIAFQFVPASDGYYYIKHPSGKYLDVVGASKERGAKVQLWSFNGNHNQQFKVEFVSSSIYKIRARHSGLYLEIGGRDYRFGAQLNQWEYKGGTNQQFLFINR